MKDLQIKKLYYSISEVSKMVGLEQYVLRYWETEFDQLRPQKNRAGNRIYTEKDIELIRLIKRLTREDRFTNEGARQILNSMSLENGIPAAPVSAPEPSAAAEPASESDVKEELRAIRASLEQLLTVLQSGSRT